MRKFTAAELQEMPTLEKGHTRNLKVREGDTSVWFDRMKVGDHIPAHEITPKAQAEEIAEALTNLAFVYQGERLVDIYIAESEPVRAKRFHTPSRLGNYRQQILETEKVYLSDQE